MKIAAGQDKAKRWINRLLPNVALKNVANRESWLKKTLETLPTCLRILTEDRLCIGYQFQGVENECSLL